MTSNLDISHLLSEMKREGVQLYPCLLYAVTKVVNRHDEFRTMINADGELGVWSEMLPCYTYFHKDSEEFSNIWTEWKEEFQEFYSYYQKDIECYGSVRGLFAKPDVPQNSFPVSMIPWTQFTGFNLNVFANENYLLPIFTFGKFYEEEGKVGSVIILGDLTISSI